MSASFINVDCVEGLDRLFATSHERPVIIFKHSITCGISSEVRRLVEQVSTDVNVVVIQSHRQLSNEITYRTGVRHQSPQAIVLVNGIPVYHASHYDIEAAHIEASMGATVIDQ